MRPRSIHLGVLAMLPAVIAHEAAHAAVSWPWVDTDDGVIERLFPPRLRLSYPAGTPVLIVVAANVAPTVAGIVVAPVVLPWTLQFELPVMVYLAGSWLLFSMPSRDDIAALAAVLR